MVDSSREVTAKQVNHESPMLRQDRLMSIKLPKNETNFLEGNTFLRNSIILCNNQGDMGDDMLDIQVTTNGENENTNEVRVDVEKISEN